MGGEPWFYFVAYQKDINSALQALRRREFQAGRYNPVTPFLEFPVDAGTPGPGAQHASIEEAITDADADGTRSILDMERISDEPDYGAVTPLSEDDLVELFGTSKPTRERRNGARASRSETRQCLDASSLPDDLSRRT